VASDHAPINLGDSGDGPTRRVDSGDPPTRRADPEDGPTVSGLSAAARVFGRYVLESLAGRGGMGVVWKARDERLNRLVALKLLPEVVAGDPEAVKDLLRETNRCLELTHPHIVRVYDLVQDGPLAAISMEFVDGESLSDTHTRLTDLNLEMAYIRPGTFTMGSENGDGDLGFRLSLAPQLSPKARMGRNPG
jgi:hypothetical protein